MEYIKAKQQIEEKYKTREISLDCLEIETNEMLDDYNFCFVALKDYKGYALLTDYANNLQEIELNENKIIEICKKHGIIFNNYHLECLYNSNQDIENYINCLKELASNNK